MNTIKKYFILTTVALVLFSCADDADLVPLGRVALSSYFSNEEEALNALTATYAQLRSFNNHDVYEWMIGDMVSDDAVQGRDDDFPFILAASQFALNADVGPLNGRWNDNYQGIYRANLIRERVPAIGLTSESPAGYNVGERIVAEATFLRGYYYFMLLKWFGGVPLVLEVQKNPDEYIVERSTVEQVWEQIEKDFKEAIENLPRKDEYGASDQGRISRGAAQAMLLKSYIYQKKWALAKPAAEAIINSNDYELEPDFAKIWLLDGENGLGSVFEIEAITIPNATTATLGLRIGEQQSYKLGFNNPTQDLVDEFESGDPRKYQTIIEKGVNDTIAVIQDEFGNNVTRRFNFNASKTGYYAAKYTRTPYDIASVSWAKNHPLNIKVIRYSDVLLMHAEACYYEGNEVLARQSLEKVRARARAGNSGILPEVTASGAALLDAIYHERRVELAMEGHRYYDILRSDRGQAIFADKMGLDFNTETHKYLPIPTNQLLVTYGALKPNPYK